MCMRMSKTLNNVDAVLDIKKRLLAQRHLYWEQIATGAECYSVHIQNITCALISDIRPPNFDILSGAHETCRYRCSSISR